MKRLKLLLGMAALACAIGLTVKYGSAYRPVVGPVREIEEIWAIEDEREESEEPLFEEFSEYVPKFCPNCGVNLRKP